MIDALELLHVEGFARDGIFYRIAVYHTSDGLQAEWSCDACQVNESEPIAHPSVEECVTSATRAVVRHHRTAHG